MTKLCCVLLVCLTAFVGFSSVIAQEEARAAWQITRFDITADVTGADRTLTSHATLSMKNVGAGAGSSITFRISQKAQVTAAQANGTSLNIRSSVEPRGNLQRVSVTLPSPAAPGSVVPVTLDYRLP